MLHRLCRIVRSRRTEWKNDLPIVGELGTSQKATTPVVASDKMGKPGSNPE
jgi:hypothetical protein